MSWIRAGRQIGQGVKNLSRLRQIVGVFAKNGFVDVVDRMSLGKLLPSRLATFAAEQAELSPAERLRISFEQLGPTFVKLGQLLSTRPDLIPESYIEEFTKLQDNVAPLPFEIVKSVLESELKKPLHESYAFVDPSPLASASIGQVHAATLHSGEPVVIKVQRPEIERIIKNDLSLLTLLASLLEKYVPETRAIGPKVIVDEFFRTLSFELDYAVEVNNMLKFSANMVSLKQIAVPKVYSTHCTHRVMTLERFEGIRINDVKALQAAHVDLRSIVEVGARAFFKSVMIDGLFHGDLHGGNLFILPGTPDSEGLPRFGIIDFGIVGRLSTRSRERLISMMAALLSEDFESLCFEYAELTTGASAVDFDAFQREVQNTLAPYLGLAVGDVNIGKVLIEATKIATKYNIKVPGEWMIVFKAIFTIEGMARSLDPDFDMVSMGQTLARDLAKNQLSGERILKEFSHVGKDLLALVQVLPRQLRWMLKKFSANDFALEIKSPDLENVRAQLEENSKQSSLSILTASFFIACSIAFQNTNGPKLGDYPVLSVFFLVMGCFGLFRLFFKLFF